MPARPMFRSTHKRYSGWSKGYDPTFSKHPAHGDDKGGVPTGKKKKADRFKSGPIGSPNGRHDVKYPADCRCGRCTAAPPKERIVYG